MPYGGSDEKAPVTADVLKRAPAKQVSYDNTKLRPGGKPSPDVHLGTVQSTPKP